MIETYIKRNFYLEKIKPFINKELIKVLVGQRRVGKSYILLQIMDLLRTKGVADSKIIYINKELAEFDEINDHNDLRKYVHNLAKTAEKFYLFIDEIQEIEDFPKALTHFQAKKNFDIYCTGSNAKMLSSEIATLLGGRYIEIKIYSLSYLEFLEFHKLDNSKESFYKFIHFGGLPFLINLELNEAVVFEYLRNIYTTILFKDVIAKFKVRNIHFLERLIEFLADNIGSLVSAKKISDFLKAQKTNISPQVVLNYLSYLTTTYFVFRVPRTALKGKKIFSIGEKYYFEDLGLRNSLVGFKPTDINKILENVVFHQLLLSGFKVTVGYAAEDKEIDFVAEKNNEKIYFQVCYMLTDQNTIDREFGNLLKINDNYPKFVLSMDESKAISSHQGIRHMHIIDFLAMPPVFQT
ncbi:MAG: ATP-binding protein [Gammaproteobacteria bacterium]|nr:ATP-binding protein [Gammaproteobacteria bacterium]